MEYVYNFVLSFALSVYDKFLIILAMEYLWRGISLAKMQLFPTVPALPRSSA
jgi:hypothetical protein